MKHPLVLLATADPATRRDVMAALNRFGYEVRTAAGGEEALDLLRTDRTIGVLVADVEAGGLGLAREARALRSALGVVYTALAPHRIPEGAKVTGAPVLRVPYAAHQLVGVIAGLNRRVLDEASPIAA
jgi:CheY-like chemotaxis protein